MSRHLAWLMVGRRIYPLRRNIKDHQRKLLIRSCGTEAKAQVRVRFAPSPTGQLHLGGLRTALYNYLFTRAHGGKFLLRIEDTDQTRLVPGAKENLISMLQWAGLDIDEGPGIGGIYGPYIQSKRTEKYWDHIQPLIQNGSAYYCFCTQRRLELLRKEALRQRETPKYDNRCRHLSREEVNEKLEKGIPYVIRFKLETHTEPWEDMVYGPITHDVADIEGDPVLLKTDRHPTYHFANIVDDHLMEITHVLRGLEWQASTTKHILLYKAFGWTPPRFAHLPLLLNRDGTKLSKRQNDIHVQYFKEKGYLPEAMLNILTVAGSGFKADTLGMDMPDLIQHFDLSLMRTNSTRLDLERAPSINRIHLQNRIAGHERHRMIEKTKELIDARLSSKCPSQDDMNVLKNEDFIGHVLDICQTRIDILEDLFSNKLSFIWFVPDPHQLVASLSSVTDLEKAQFTISETVELLESLDENDLSDTQQMSSHLKVIVKKHKIGMKTFMVTLRIALSGLKEGPSVAEMVSILGKRTSLNRLHICKVALADKSKFKNMEELSAP